MTKSYKSLYNNLLTKHLELSGLLVPTVMENNALKSEVQSLTAIVEDLEEKFQKANAAALKNLEKMTAKEVKAEKSAKA